MSIHNKIEEAKNSFFKTSEIFMLENILKLPRTYRFYAAREILDSRTLDLYKCVEGERRNESERWEGVEHGLLEKAVAKLAYAVADFGRYQSTWTGENTIPARVKVRREYGERYRGRYTSTDLYADYFFSAADDAFFKFRVKLPGWEKSKTMWLSDLIALFKEHNVSYPPMLFEQRHFVNAGFEFDERECAIWYNGDVYHIFPQFVWGMEKETLNWGILVAIRAFKRRRDERRNDAEFNALDLEAIEVTVADSLEAGNCETETLAFARRYFKNHEEEPVTAAQIWAVRKDAFTRRAIIQAANRQR